MEAQEQIEMHAKCIAYDVKHNKLERIIFHLKGIYRAIFS